MSGEAPRGRDAVRRALLDAATKLFARHGPHAVSVRDIAGLAGVNHGLVHRHFGSKDALLGEVLERLSLRLAAALPPADPEEKLETLLPHMFAATRSHRAYWQVLARAVLEGHDPAKLQPGFPVVDRIREAMARRLGEEAPKASMASMLTALLVATGLGLVVFEPYLRAATGLDARRWKDLEALVPQGLATLLPRGGAPDRTDAAS